MAKVKAKAKAKATPISPPKEGMVKVVVLKDFPGHKKGEVYLAPERKVRSSAREIRKGLIKPV